MKNEAGSGRDGIMNQGKTEKTGSKGTKILTNHVIVIIALT